MYHDFLGPRGLQGTHMDTKEKSKSITFTVRGGFFTILGNPGPLCGMNPAQGNEKFLTLNVIGKLMLR